MVLELKMMVLFGTDIKIKRTLVKSNPSTSKHSVGRESVVGIANRYVLDGSGIESRWGRDISQPSRPALGSTQAPIQWVPGLFPGDKAAGAWS
jgi:hypothetical protein